MFETQRGGDGVRLLQRETGRKRRKLEAEMVVEKANTKNFPHAFLDLKPCFVLFLFLFCKRGLSLLRNCSGADSRPARFGGCEREREKQRSIDAAGGSVPP